MPVPRLQRFQRRFHPLPLKGAACPWWIATKMQLETDRKESQSSPNLAFPNNNNTGNDCWKLINNTNIFLVFAEVQMECQHVASRGCHWSCCEMCPIRLEESQGQRLAKGMATTIDTEYNYSNHQTLLCFKCWACLLLRGKLWQIKNNTHLSMVPLSETSTRWELSALPLWCFRASPRSNAWRSGHRKQLQRAIWIIMIPVTDNDNPCWIFKFWLHDIC